MYRNGRCCREIANCSNFAVGSLGFASIIKCDNFGMVVIEGKVTAKTNQNEICCKHGSYSFQSIKSTYFTDPTSREV